MRPYRHTSTSKTAALNVCLGCALVYSGYCVALASEKSRLESPPGKKFVCSICPPSQLSFNQNNDLHFRLEDTMAREMTGRRPSYDEDNKMKSETLHNYLCIRLIFSSNLSDSHSSCNSSADSSCLWFVSVHIMIHINTVSCLHCSSCNSA